MGVGVDIRIFSHPHPQIQKKPKYFDGTLKSLSNVSTNEMHQIAYKDIIWYISTITTKQEICLIIDIQFFYAPRLNEAKRRVIDKFIFFR
jgi:hypothetical protein